MSLGLMQDHPLTTRMLLDRMSSQFPSKTVTTMRHGSCEIRTYAQVATRARQLANALQTSKVSSGDRVSTLLWNCNEHLELYLAVPSMGAVLHTVNLRLPALAISEMFSETLPKVIVIDETGLGLLKQVNLPSSVAAIIVVGQIGDATDDASLIAGYRPMEYEQWIAAASDQFDWPDLTESSASGICYTSGTSGKAKGVMYSHRSTVLHAMAMLFTDGIALSEHDVCMPIVPMFHAQGWGFPYGACLSGASLVLSHRSAEPVTLARLIQATGVTIATAVPTVWIALLSSIRSGEVNPLQLKSLKRLPIGGAAVTSDLFVGFSDLGIQVQQCWGMTEVSPLGLVSTRRSWLSDEQWQSASLTAGVVQVGCEIRVKDANGEAHQAPQGGAGELQIRGPWVASRYLGFGNPTENFSEDPDGNVWLRTGDIAVIDINGYVKIVDRAKDLIKSGGEWISSADLESALSEHPAVREAAVVGIPDLVWQERPLAFVCLSQSADRSAIDFASYLENRFPRWQVPDRFIILQELPRGTTGKVDKRQLKELVIGR
jgi:fatty-acyl-CoA synthase